MFTVKQIIENATSLYETQEITIAREGSPQWKQAFELANELRIKNPDILEFTSPIYADEDMTKVLREESILSTERDNVSLDDCIAIVCSTLPIPAFPEAPEQGGCGYQFLYKGDQLYITNDSGAIVEAVK
ncbi:hypothetical protein [Xenorhabdus hominickii]|uniref:UpfA n=1 Tax=Xenorhabdus hominickii TaxID=351679 RepID=A0A2G0Q2Z0_XENHO|nr:hypothetical protein [Xenorhabdus hominickii]AOM39801.1 hypothetical protein A9255_03940 [Xenorhabdus hominickii]PHM53579.1 UpfA [Xenorhabdus hominickii]